MTADKCPADALTDAIEQLNGFLDACENGSPDDRREARSAIHTFYRRAMLAVSPVEQHEASPADAQALWKTGTPPTQNGKHNEYIVAVRRAHDKRRVFVFAASHANNYADELRDQDGNEFIADGWYDIGEDPSGEFNTLFTPMLGENDAVLGWQELPKWNEPAVTQPEPAVADERAAFDAFCERCIDAADDVNREWLFDVVCKWQARASSPNAAGAKEPPIPSELHRDTAKLVRRFARALAHKLLSAQRKYGYSDNWMRDHWADECRAELMRHIHKGDPRDVAAYCAFLWHHNESTAPAQAAEPVAIPTGWKAMPLTITPAMRMAMAEAASKYMQRTGGNSLDVIYEAALKVAPPPPAQASAPVGLRDDQRSTLESLARTSTPYEQEVLRALLEGAKQ
ncbi:hypothetical protein MK974_24375 [Burkholderia ambifaria]|uniref:hypothetical protein n=1 Tax=Burkholderia ambifaria TaxID=152480 RepID=UPI0022A9E523|nr:hypothetical protein [Burkholderia ambifaria]WAS56239.1 hypothetical protein MK974_24375 [Burkholderia ambifaria]